MTTSNGSFTLPTGGGFAPSRGPLDTSAGPQIVHAAHGAGDEDAYAMYAAALGLPVVPVDADDQAPGMVPAPVQIIAVPAAPAPDAVTASIVAKVRAALGQPVSGTPVRAAAGDAEWLAVVSALGLDDVGQTAPAGPATDEDDEFAAYAGALGITPDPNIR